MLRLYGGSIAATLGLAVASSSAAPDARYRAAGLAPALEEVVLADLADLLRGDADDDRRTARPR